MITTEQIKELREQTGISVMQCKKALTDADGDIERALDLLRKKGTEIASKKAGRTLKAGVIASYIHSDSRMGVLVELLCETDFVARNSDFRELADDIALHVAATNPQYLSGDEISEDDRKQVRETFSQEVKGMDLPAPSKARQAGKPEDIKEKVLAGKVDTYFKENVLLDQAFVKDPSKTINDLVLGGTQKLGEKIEIARFKRFVVLGN